jgi:hypothetical protein
MLVFTLFLTFTSLDNLISAESSRAATAGSNDGARGINCAARTTATIHNNRNFWPETILKMIDNYGDAP